jgi:hypothetical protein
MKSFPERANEMVEELQLRYRLELHDTIKRVVLSSPASSVMQNLIFFGKSADSINTRYIVTQNEHRDISRGKRRVFMDDIALFRIPGCLN